MDNNNDVFAVNFTAQCDNVLRLNISIAESRKSLEWQNRRISWAQLRDKLSIPTYTPESAAEYLAMPSDVKADIKDVGGWVGGVVQGGRRIRGSVPYRQVLALDLDTTTIPFDEMVYKLGEVWQFKCLIHTTRSYSKLTPRYRCVIPLSRQVDAVEYEAIGRYIANLHDINQFDPTTYQSTRLMYFPSCSKDGFFAAKELGGDVLKVEEVLCKYKDPRDNTQWAYADNDSPHAHIELQTAQDPLQKGGVVGAFCKAYPIRTVLEVMLGAYYKLEPNGRYTYIGGSSSGGVVVYDDRWCYSHHSTDPNRELLLNAFDLYRRVQFGALDFSAPQNCKPENMPSYRAMVEWCGKDAKVQQFFIPDEARDIANFANYDTQDEEQVQETPDWLLDLITELDKSEKTGQINCTLKNYAAILTKDANIIKAIQYDVFTDKINIIGKLPWERFGGDAWTDSDDASARIYIDRVYGIRTNKSYYDDAFAHVIGKAGNHTDSALEFINRGEWDGVERAETLIINTLGIEDTELNRAQTLIWLKAVVARQLLPGVKFDNMLVLSGSEGIGKSTLFKLLVGEKFFTDSFSFGWDSKRMYEAIEGKLIVECAELDGFDKKEAEAVKAFLSSSSDRYRRAYARIATEVPRRCVFAGSTNHVEVLRSQAGNRRMWIMQCNKDAIITPVWELLTTEYVEQLWAEVRTKYAEDNRLYLSQGLTRLQREQQKEFTQEDPIAGEILQYIKIWLPEQWEVLSERERRMYITSVKNGGIPSYPPHHRRETVSAVEFVKEWMGLDVDGKTQYLTKQINTAIRSIDGVESAGQVRDRTYARLRSFYIPECLNGSLDQVAYRPTDSGFSL